MPRDAELVKRESAVATPPGFSAGDGNAGPRRRHEVTIEALTSQAWSVASNPLKQIGMLLVMLYFSGGGSPSIFSIFLYGMGISSLLRMLYSNGDSFERLAAARPNNQGSGFLVQRLAYVASCVVAMCALGYMAAGSGLLPINSADFLEFLPPRGDLPRVLVL